MFSKLLAEFIATFALVFIGSGAVHINIFSNGALGLTGIALAHGLVLMTMVYATGHISGAHINPAVTFGMFITKNIKGSAAFGYILAQLSGSVVAGVLLVTLLPYTPNGDLGVTKISSDISAITGMGIEAVLTFFLVFVIFGTAVDSKAPAGMYGLAIGLVLTFDILVGGTLTGASMNPARTFGPALISGFWEHHWVYWIGPLLGGSAATIIYKKFLQTTD